MKVDMKYVFNFLYIYIYICIRFIFCSPYGQSYAQFTHESINYKYFTIYLFREQPFIDYKFY